MVIKGKGAAKKGLSAATFAGLNQNRMSSSAGGSNRIKWEEGKSVPIQFLTDPTEFREFYQHVFQDEGKWNYVPCAGDGCPLCVDEDERKRKKSYQFYAVAYDLKERKVSIAKGPKTLATQIFYRYQRKPSMFLKRVYDVTRFPTTPVSYGFDIAEEPPVDTTKVKHDIDLDEAINSELKRYYGDDLASAIKASSLDDDDPEFEDEDEDDEEEESEDEPDEEELEEMEWADLKKYARSVGVKKDTRKRSELISAIMSERG
jgi:hypothetical protein